MALWQQVRAVCRRAARERCRCYGRPHPACTCTVAFVSKLLFHPLRFSDAETAFFGKETEGLSSVTARGCAALLYCRCTHGSAGPCLCDIRHGFTRNISLPEHAPCVSVKAQAASRPHHCRSCWPLPWRARVIMLTASERERAEMPSAWPASMPSCVRRPHPPASWPASVQPIPAGVDACVHHHSTWLFLCRAASPGSSGSGLHQGCGRCVPRRSMPPPLAARHGFRRPLPLPILAGQPLLYQHGACLCGFGARDFCLKEQHAGFSSFTPAWSSGGSSASCSAGIPGAFPAAATAGGAGRLLRSRAVPGRPAGLSLCRGGPARWLQLLCGRHK